MRGYGPSIVRTPSPGAPTRADLSRFALASKASGQREHSYKKQPRRPLASLGGAAAGEVKRVCCGVSIHIHIYFFAGLSR